MKVTLGELEAPTTPGAGRTVAGGSVVPFMIDTMIYDRLGDEPEVLRRVVRLIGSGRIELLTTHIQRDEIARIHDTEKRERLLAIPAHPIATAGFVWGVSRWGLSRWGTGGADGVEFDEVQRGNPDHDEDALIAITAAEEADVLIANDLPLTRRIRRRANRLKVWSYEEFKTDITRLDGGSSRLTSRLT